MIGLFHLVKCSSASLAIAGGPGNPVRGEKSGQMLAKSWMDVMPGYIFFTEVATFTLIMALMRSVEPRRPVRWALRVS